MKAIDHETEMMAASSRAGSTGTAMWDFMRVLYPICRSITGNGVRETLRQVRELIPLDIHEVPTGTQVLDWTVPREWNIRDAYIATLSGRRVVDFRDLNLHVVNYSVPVRRRVSLTELKQHLFSLPEQPELVPYRTSYYTDTWGFCVSERVLQTLTDTEYEVCIDSSLEDGALTYGESFLGGSSDDEVLVSCHCCHPSLANDNLSGIAVAAFLARALQGRTLRYSYRFLFIPGTIGSITWLSRNEHRASRIKHGLVVACVGDRGSCHYKRSRRGNAEIDRAVEHVFQHRGASSNISDFSPYGYDERQYCSPGFNLPVGCFSRTPHGRFPEYHTSADNLDFVHADSLADSLSALVDIVDLLERNARYVNTLPKGEPQLGRRGLYRAFGGVKNSSDLELALLWVLNLSDGQHTLLDIAERSGMHFDVIAQSAEALLNAGLLQSIATDRSLPGGQQ